MLKRFIFIAAVIPILISESSGEIEKRQVGMLARSGELPSRGGKRSVGALARNGELPGKRSPLWDSDEQQRLRMLSNWLKEMNAAITLEQVLQHDVAKRNMEAMARAGYLIKPATEAPEPRTGFLDSDEFLGKLDDVDADYGEYADGFGSSASKRGGLAALARHGYIGKRDELVESDAEDDAELDGYPSAAEKRHVAAAKSFISRFAKRNIGASRNFAYGKRHIGAARNFAFDYDNKRNVASARRFTGKRNVGSARNFQFRETKKNVGAARQFFAGSSKKNIGSARSFLYGKRNLASLARDGGIPSVKYLGHEDDYPWEDENQFDFDDFHDEEKRNLASYVKSLHGKRYLGSLRAGKRASEPDGDDASLPLAFLQADSSYENLPEFPGVDHNDGSSAIAKRETKDDGETGQGQSNGNASRRKRSAEYAFSSNELPVDLQEYADYEDAAYPNVYQKRFLGESADSWAVSKRHIGALARMGLLPSFRNTRYSRSGRAIRNRIVPFREDPPIRSCSSAKDSASSWSKAPSVASQLVVRSPSRYVAFAPHGSRARHPMAFHKSFYL